MIAASRVFSAMAPAARDESCMVVFVISKMSLGWIKVQEMKLTYTFEEGRPCSSAHRSMSPKEWGTPHVLSRSTLQLEVASFRVRCLRSIGSIRAGHGKKRAEPDS